MKKTAFISAICLVAGLCLFVISIGVAFAGCLLDAEFTDSSGSGEPDIVMSSDGKTVDGYLKVLNSDIVSCSVKVDFRVYKAAYTKKIASKTITFGSIAPGAEVTKKFTLTSKKQLWGKSLTAVINPSIIQDDGDTFEEDDGNISIELSAQATPDLVAEWGTVTLSSTNKKVSGELTVSNIGDGDSGRFVVTTYIDDGGPMRMIRKFNINSLGAGEARTLKISYSSMKSLEWTALLAHADFYDDIYETDNENNMAGSDILWDHAASCGDERIYLRGFEQFSITSKIPSIQVVGTRKIVGLRLVNCGDTDLSITEISDDSDEFSVNMSGLVAGVVIAPKEYADISMSFRPAEKGVRTATLTIKTDDPETPVKTVTVAGKGL